MESYLSPMNGTSAECSDGRPERKVTRTCLSAGGYPATEAGLEKAIREGWAQINLGIGADTDITVLDLERQLPVLSLSNGRIIMFKGHVCGKGTRIITTPAGEARVKAAGLEPLVVDSSRTPLCRRPSPAI